MLHTRITNPVISDEDTPANQCALSVNHQVACVKTMQTSTKTTNALA